MKTAFQTRPMVVMTSVDQESQHQEEDITSEIISWKPELPIKRTDFMYAGIDLE